MKSITAFVPVCVIICIAFTNGVSGGRRGTRPKALVPGDQSVGGTVATGDSLRRHTRPKLIDAMAETSSEPDQNDAARQRTRARPKRSEIFNDPDQSSMDGVSAPARDVVQRLGLLENWELQSEVATDTLNAQIRDVAVLTRILWRTYCARQGLVFDTRTVSCQKRNGEVDKKGWGNPGVNPGK